MLKYGRFARTSCPRSDMVTRVNYIWVILVTATMASAASWKFPCPEDQIAKYEALRVSEPITVDGRLDEAAWKAAPRSPRFVDIITGKPAIHDTQAAVLWDEENLYVGFWVEEPLVQAKYTNHNDPIYYDNDVEVFIAGKDAYYEFEVNAFNTVYEAFFIWKDAYESGGFSALPDFQRSKIKPFNGVGFKTHPRGERLGAFDWTFPGKKTAVWVNGTINDHKDRDRGWTVELAFPLKVMALLLKAFPPRDGDELRMDFSRFNTYKAAPPGNDSGGWVWTRHGIWDSHIPECFVQVRFRTNTVSEAGFVSLFDGKTLDGWNAADPSYWSIEDGAITGRITKEHPCNTNQYLVWMGGNLGDFELKLKSRVTGEGEINNGFQFRSRVMADRDVAGYQVDNNLKTDWLVRLYDEHGRHTLAWRGQRTVFNSHGEATHSKVEEAPGPAPFNLEDWHEYHLICDGPRLTLRVNGTLMAEVIDGDPLHADAAGILALQLHSGPPTFVQFKDIRLKKLRTTE
jgi:3-keto-disaccharide hydrolase/cellulose/xylan binding protein with CBM9 domain